MRLYGGPYHRPTGLLTNCPWLVKAARLCREAGPHRHIPVEDKASEAAEYPFDMCDQWAEAFSQWISNQGIPSPGEYIREGAYANKLLRPEFDLSRKRQRTNQTSSKEAREQENDECVGGMRNPHHAVAKGSGWISWGRQARVTLDEVLRRHPGVLQLVDRLGTEMSDNEVARLQDQLQAAGATASKQMAKELGLQGKEGTEKGPTGWRFSLVAAITSKAGDIDPDVAEWLRGATPLGITREIPPRGVFPPPGPTKAQLESAEFMAQRAGTVEVERNYKSFEENQKESEQEMAWLEAEGHLERVGDWGQILQRWPRAIATKVATLVKQKSDGTQKVRFIVDMLRSGINSLATAGERIVLPRAMDLINSTLDLWEAAKPGESLEFLTIDIADAFLNLRIAERASAIVRAQNGDYLVYRGVPFGLATAPLLWGAVAAWMGRATQTEPRST